MEEPISPAVLSKAKAKIEARPINEASNFFDFDEIDEHTGQNYRFFLNSKENSHKIKAMPSGITTIHLSGRFPSRSWRGEEIGVIELAGLQFVAFKIFPLLVS